MKIAFLRRLHTPHGGAQKLLEPLMRQLAERDHEVHLYSERWPNVPGVQVHRISSRESSPSARLREYVYQCRERIPRQRFDLTFGWDPVSPLDIFRAGDGLCEPRREALADVRGLLGRQMARLDAEYRSQLALEREIFVPGSCRHVVTNSLRTKFEIHRIYRLPQDAIHVIYNGVDLERYHPREKSWWRPETRKRLGVAGGDMVVLFVGNDFERQGLDLTIHAMAEGFPKRGARLLVAGAGDPERYEALARRAGLHDRILFLGVVDVVQQYYAAADVLVHPARYDPFPHSIIEALASGLPVLTTPTCGGAEAIEDGKSGYIAESASQLVDGLRLLADADRRAEMGELARRRALTFELDEQVRKMTELIVSVARGKGIDVEEAVPQPAS